MAEQDIFSLLGDDEGKISSDMNDLNPTLGVTPEMQQQQQQQATQPPPAPPSSSLTAASNTTTVVTAAAQPNPPKQQQQQPQQQTVTLTNNVLTGNDPMLSQGVGRAVASQLTSVQVKQMNTPSNPMWGSARSMSTPQQQTIILQQGKAGGKLTMSHHDYAISGQKPAALKVGQQLQIQKQQTVQSQLQQRQQLQQQNVIQQQLQLSQQQQQQIKQQLQQLQQKQMQLQQQQSQQKQTATQVGFQRLQGGQTITLSGLQQKALQQSPGKITVQQGGQTFTLPGLQQSPNKLTIGGTPQQPTIVRLPVSMTQPVQQQQSLHITPSSAVQTVTLGQPKLATTIAASVGQRATPRFIITRQPTQAQQAAGGTNQPVQLQLQMQDVNALQKNIGKLQTLPGGQVIRLQPAQQQQQGGVQTVLQQQPRFTLTNNAAGAKVGTVQQGTAQPQQQAQRVITLTPQQAQQLFQRSGGQGLTLVSQGAAGATTTTSPMVRTVVLPQASSATSVGQVLRTLAVPQQSTTTASTTKVVSTAAGLATQNLNLLASQAAGANTAAAQQVLQRMVVSSSGQIISKPGLVMSQGQVTLKPGLVATQGQVAPKPGLVATQGHVAPKPSLVATQGQVVPKPGLMATQGQVTTKPMMMVSQGQVTAKSGITVTQQAPSPARQPLVRTVTVPQTVNTVTTPTVTTQVATTQIATTQIASTSSISSPIKTTGLASASVAQLAKHLMANSGVSGGASASATHTITTNASGQQVLSTILPQKQVTPTSSAAPPLQMIRTPVPQPTTATAAATTAATKPPGGKITISSATAQMLAQKGIVLTRTPQGTFVAKIPQSMLSKAAAGQAGNTLNLLTNPQGSATVAQSTVVGTPPQATTVKTPAKAKSQPTILSKGKSKKLAKTPPGVGTMIVSSPSASTSTMPKLMFTIGGQQVTTVPTSMSAVDQKPKVVVSMKPVGGISAAEEVKKIGEELGKLQGQSKTPENLQKLKDLHSKLKQLQLTVQASAVVAKSRSSDASTSAKSSEDTDGDSKSPKDDKERRKLMKQRQLQEKANRIVAEAVAKAKASGLKDIPKIMINVALPEVTDEDAPAKPKKEKSKRPKSSKPKSSRPKPTKAPKIPKPVKEKKIHVPSKKKAKKLPLAALNKLKKQRKKFLNLNGEESESSEYDETPPPTPDPELSALLEKRRSSRNTNKKKKYTEEYDFNITDSSSSSSDDDNDGAKPPKVKKERRSKQERTTVMAKESEDGDTNVEIDVETVEPSMLAGGEQAKFFVDNPDESQANIVEKILARRTVKKPQLPGEAQVGEVEEFFVKYRSYSYLHCEWCTQDKLLKGDPRIPQKIRRFRAKQFTISAQMLQDLEDEPFNPDYIEVERVIDKAITEDPDNPGQMVTHYLIKWCGLPYEDATWEVPEDVDQDKAKLQERYSKVPSPSERKRVSKPPLSAWKKMDKTKVYDNDNILREYQLEGVNWLTFSWYNSQNCILADEMGLGKTIQAITFLEEVRSTGIRGPFLVIAPLSTIANWQREFQTWTDVNCVVYHGSSQSRHMIAEYEMYYKDTKGRIVPNIYKFHVLITTYEIVLADCQELSEIEWRVCIIDEAHRLKNRNCKLIEGLKILDLEHRVLLTGTPLQNNVEELFSLLNFLDPGNFRSSHQFMEQFGDLKSESQVEKLQQILRPMMLRRLKEDVEKNLAPKEETIIEVELTNIQKKYYRAILERNFNFLNKGTSSNANLPNLMNTMMELRKCCNHPFLIKGAEDQIMLEFQNLPEEEMPFRHLKALVQSAGKMVLLDKLLPKLRDGGHKVLVFSQMIRCLDLLEDYLIQKQYPFERIDGRVRGNMRQAAIDRFSKPDSDRFVFLLCTRAGGLGINLTAADTCVIFDSDWNPQNDLQAQARCHRIGQKKAVKIYRLITRNSYEREMFDKASMKLGLDKAVLQSMRNTEKDTPNAVQPMSKIEIEDLLKRGAYGAIMDDDDDLASKFCEEDIDIILQRRTQIVKIEAGIKGSTFAKASFSLSGDKHASEIKLDDPDFWEKWAKRAELDVDQLKNRENMVIDAPRQRKQTKRYGNMDMVELTSSSSDSDADPPPSKTASSTSTATTKTTTKEKKEPPPPEKPSKKQLQSGWTRLECFRVEKGLLTYGWGRWNDIISTTRFKRRLGEKDIEAISRTMLIYCLLHYKGDENIKSFIWDLVTPSADGTVKDYKNHKGLSAPVPRGRKGRKPKKEEPVVPAILEYDFNNKDQDPETLLTDQGYKNHLKRHCNKVLLRVRLLYYLKQEVIGDTVEQIEQGASISDIKIAIPSPEGEPPLTWWDEEADRSLMVGVFKHGYERYIAMRTDPTLCFLDKCGPPNQLEIARENNDDFNDSQLDVEGTDGMDMMDDVKPSMKDDLLDSLDANDKDESMSSAPPSRTGSPAPNKPKLDPIIPCQPGKLPFPPAPDLNTRLRRLVATFQRNHKREQMKVAKRERREHVKKIRFEEQARQRELRKLEHAQKLEEQHKQKELRKLELAQKWSRREEADFYRILAAYGVEINPETTKYEWNNFKKLAKLEKKYDDRMQEYYEHFRVMCLKVCKKDDMIPDDWDTRPPPEFAIELISEERANKCLHRIDLLLKIRNEVLPHPDRDRRLKRCRRSMELPEWWEPGKHDRDLIIGTARYGVNRMESQMQMMNDPDLSFQELKEKYPKWHLPASAFFPPAPPKPPKKPEIKIEKTEKDENAAPVAEASTSSSPSTSAAQPESSGIKQEAIDPDTGEERSSPVEVKQEQDGDAAKMELGEGDVDRMDDSQCSSQSSPGGGVGVMDKLSQDSTNLPVSSLENEESSQNSPNSSQQKLNSQDGDSLLNYSENSSQNHLAASSQGPTGSSLETDAKEEGDEKMDVNPPVVTTNCNSQCDDDDDRTKTEPLSVDGLVAQRELCRPPDGLGAIPKLEDRDNETKMSSPGMVSATYLNAAEFMRWPKDRVIVHRLEQISHCVLKGEWPGRRRHHHNDPSRNQGGSHPGEGRGDGIVTPAEHNYAGDDGREVTKTILPKKKKRRKRAEIEQERAAQLAVLLGQNPSLGLHPVFSSLMTSLPLAGAQMPTNLAAAAMSPLDLSQSPTAATSGGAAAAAATSRYHIQDAEFRAGEAGQIQQAMLAAQLAAGMQHPGMQHHQMMHKKKKKHKAKMLGGVGAGQVQDPEEKERRRRRKLELIEKKRRRKRKQKDKAKEMSDAFNALKDDDHVPVMNPRTGERYVGPAAPMKKQLGAWMKEHPGFELLYPFHAVVSPDGTSVSFPPLPQTSHDDTQSDEPPKKKKKKSQRNPAKLDPTKLTGEEHVDMIDRVTGKRLPSKLNPSLNNLAEWLVRNPAYDVVSEWGSIVKAKGYISEEQFSRVSELSMKPTATYTSSSSNPVASSTNAAQDAAAMMASGIGGGGAGGTQGQISMQIGQGNLGGLGLSSFASLPIASQPGQTSTPGNDAMAIAAAAQQLVNMQTSPLSIQSQPSKKPIHKKKKFKTSHPPITLSKPIVTTPPPSIPPPPVSGVPSLAGISPYLLPTQGGVFYSPFLASHNVQGLMTAATTAVASATTTTTTTSSTNSLDNTSQSSSVDSNHRTELREGEDNSLDAAIEEQGMVAMNDAAQALVNFTDENDDGTFAGVDLGDLDGELGDDVINEISMEQEQQIE